MAYLSGFQRAVLGNFNLTRSTQRRLVKSIFHYKDCTLEEREVFHPPYRHMGWPLAAWVILQMGIDRPFFVVFGPISAVALYLVFVVRAIWKAVL